MFPRLSIITICFNNPEELLATCASVDKQTSLPYEHWIIDGSTDTAIREYLSSHSHPPYRKWISEPDKGIADAFNKGIRLAGGEILNMLNAGDYYINEYTLDIVKQAFQADLSLQWLHSKYQLQRGGLWVTIGKPFEKSKLYRGMRSLAHQSMFVKRSLHDKYGLYDTSLSIAMDYDFVCRIADEKFVFIERPLIVFAPEGISSVNYLKALEQTKDVYERHFNKSWKPFIWQIRLKVLYYLMRSPVGKLLYRLKARLKLENM